MGRSAPRTGTLVLLVLTVFAPGGVRNPRSAAAEEPPPSLRTAMQAEHYVEAESLAVRWLDEARRRTPVDSEGIVDALTWRTRAHLWGPTGAGDRASADSARFVLAWNRRHPGRPRALAEALLLATRTEGAHPDTMLAMALAARALLTPLVPPHDSMIVETWDWSGRARRGLEPLAAARADFARALEIERSGGASPHRIVALLAQQGACWMQEEQLDSARVAIEEAVRIGEACPDPAFDALEAAYTTQTLLEGDAGDYVASLDASSKGWNLALRRYRPDAAVFAVFGTLLNRASALRESGDLAGAQALLERLDADAERHLAPGRERPLVVADESLADLFEQRHDLAGAIRMLDRIDRLAHAVGFADRQAMRSIRAEALAGLGRPREALAINDSALADERGRSAPADFLAQQLTVRVPITWALRDTAALDSTLARLADLAAPLAPGDPVRGDIEFSRAWGALHRNRRDEAWSLALEVDDFHHRLLRSALATLPDRALLGIAGKQGPALSLLCELARSGDEARRRIFWDHLIASRGGSLEAMTRRHVPASLERDPAVAAAHRRWRESQLRFARTIVAGGAGTDSAQRASEAAQRTDAEEAERAYAALLAARGATLPPAEPALADVESRLKPGEALVGMLETESSTDTARVTALVARAGDPRVAVVELGRSRELENEIEPWLERLATPVGPDARDAERACRRAGEVVRRATWDRLAPALAGVHTVYVVPAGPVARVPWAALPSGANRYLVETEPAIRMLNSERELGHARVPRPDRLVAIGDPAFGGTPVSAPLAVALTRGGGDPCGDYRTLQLEALPGTRDEVLDAARIERATGAAARTLLGAEATESAFRRAVSGATIVHVATHGVVATDTCGASARGLRGVGGLRPVAHGTVAPPAGAGSPVSSAQNPWLERRVWLAFAGANEAVQRAASVDDGLLTAEEVGLLDFRDAEWVVLSACRSGAAERWSREGAVGLRRAFHSAGAAQVIASDWSIGDTSTRELMDALYTARAAGEHDAGAALRIAERKVLAARRKSGRSTHPFTWAAFSATGH